MTKEEMRERLEAPFMSSEIEWRVGQVMSETYAKLLAYITSRAVMNRLDDVFGIDGWEDEYEILDKGVKCSLTVTIEGNPITRQDGAEYSNIESFKGGISDALKRTAVKFGIGRYLYNLGETIVALSPNKPKSGEYKWVKGNKYFIVPSLPDWALPENERGKKTQKPKHTVSDEAKQKVSKSQLSEMGKMLKELEKKGITEQQVKEKALALTGQSDVKNYTDEEAKNVLEMLESMLKEPVIEPNKETKPNNQKETDKSAEQVKTNAEKMKGINILAKSLYALGLTKEKLKEDVKTTVGKDTLGFLTDKEADKVIKLFTNIEKIMKEEKSDKITSKTLNAIYDKIGNIATKLGVPKEDIEQEMKTKFNVSAFASINQKQSEEIINHLTELEGDNNVSN